MRAVSDASSDPDIELVLADGTAHQATVADVYTVVDGKVTHMQAYADPSDVPA